MVETRLDVVLGVRNLLTRGFARARQTVTRFTRQLTSGFRRLNRQVFRLRTGLLALGAAITGGAFATLIKRTADTTDQFGKLSERLGLTTEFLSETTFAAERAGINARTLELSLQRVNRRFGEIARTGRGTALSALKEFDESILQAVRSGATFEQLLPQIAEEFAKVEDQTRRLSIAFQLFDAEGARLVTLLQAGGDAVRQLRAEGRFFGATITTDQTQRAAEFNDTLTNLTTTIRGLARTIVDRALPQITQGLRDLTLFIINNRSSIVGFFDDVRTAFVGVARVAAEVARFVDRLQRQVRFLNALREGNIGRAFQLAIEGQIDDVIDKANQARLDRLEVFRIRTRQLFEEIEGEFVGPRQDLAIPAGGFRSALASPEVIGRERLLNTIIQERFDQTKRLNEEREEANRLLDEQLRTTEMLASASQGLAAATADIQQRFSAFNIARNTLNQIADTLADSIGRSLDALITQSEKFRDILKDILRDLRRIAFRAVGQIAVGALFRAPGFQGGGVVTGSGPTPAILHPPEAVVPLQRGQIPVRLEGGGGGQRVTIVNNIQATDADSFRRLFEAQAVESRDVIGTVFSQNFRDRPSVRRRLL